MYNIEKKIIQGQEYAITEYDVQGKKVLMSAIIFPQDKKFVTFVSRRPTEEAPSIEALTTLVLIEDFFNDIGFIMKYLDKHGTGPDKAFKSLAEMCQNHIKSYGRLIDSDLYAYIDKFIIALYSILKTFHQVELNQQDSKDIWLKMRKEMFAKFSDNIFLTRYDFSNSSTPKATLVKLTDLK